MLHNASKQNIEINKNLSIWFLKAHKYYNTIETPKFSRDINPDFSKTLRKRVNSYFKTHNTSRHANRAMVVKTIIMICLFFVPLIVLSSGIVSSVWMLFLLYIISGFGMAGIGMGVMHDAIHGSYSKHKIVNTLLGYTFNLIGANATIWNIQHNVLHHTYTNIDHADDDLNSPYFLRFSPNAKHYWIHKYQHIYIWFFYSLSTISWITAKDFVRLKHFRDMGFFKEKRAYNKALASMAAWKLFYYSYALILPIIMVPYAWWIILLAFLCMHIITGLLVSVVFQVAHIMSVNEFPLPDTQDKMNSNWYGHQFATTCNFSPNSKLVFWFLGGLNYQVEHHVLPDVCHIHYKNITKIVSDTAEEFGMPYHVKKTFFSAISDHTKMLRLLGQKQTDGDNYEVLKHTKYV